MFCGAVVLLMTVATSGFLGPGQCPAGRRRLARSASRDDDSDPSSDEAIADLLRRANALRDSGNPEEDVQAARRREAEALAAELRGEDVGESVSGVDGAVPVPRMDRPSSDPSEWPKFGGRTKGAAPAAFGGALGGGALDNFGGGGPSLAALTAEDMEDPELQALVLRQMTNAFDNYPPREVEDMYERLWAAGPIKSVRKLVEAVRDADAVEVAYFRDRRVSDERAGDEIRACRSRIRMYGKDAEFLPNADGSPRKDMWGDLGDWIPWRWKPE